MHITAEMLTDALTYEELIPAMKQVLMAFSAGEVVQPMRQMVSSPKYPGRFAVMTALYGDVMGTKLVSIYPENAKLGLPTHASVMHLFDAKTGLPLASLDADLVTTMRTAAVSSIAVDLLAPGDASILAVIGAGVQGRAHACLLKQTRAFHQVLIANRSRANGESLAAEVGGSFCSILDAVREADIIVLATSSTEPLLLDRYLKDRHLKRRRLIIAVGAVGPTLREMDDAAMRGSIVVESRLAAQQESGDILQSGAAIYAELGELLSGSKPIPEADRIVFKSVGIAAEDVATAQLIYTKLKSAGKQTPDGES